MSDFNRAWILENGLDDLLDQDLYEDLLEQQDDEQEQFKDYLKADFATLLD